MKDRLNWVDAVLCAIVVTGTIVYLTAFPLHLGISSDEPRQLHEAKRILEGDVMYRDVFDFILPGWIYLLTLCYSLFGATLATARATIAVVHGVTAGLLFLACRRLAVRRELACTVPMAYLVVSQPAFPVASQHWLATALSVSLLAVCLAPWRRLALRAFALGMVAGALIAVLQQRGTSMGLGVASFLVVDALLAWRYGQRLTVSLPRQLIALAVGGAVVLVPLFTWLIVRGGFTPLWQAVVVYPLVNYHSTFSLPLKFVWGRGGNVMSFPRLIKILPFFLVLPILRLAVLSLRRKEWERTRALAALSVLSLFAVFSISYLPDFVHIALITPFFFVIIAEELESVLGWLPTGAQSTVRWIVALSVLGAGIVRLHDNLGTARGIATQPYESAFGRVDIPPSYADFYERLDALLRDVPGRTLYVHPDASYTYLLVGACNPTRFEFVNLPYHGLKEVQEVVDDLEATAPPYVLVRQYLLKRDDPIFRLIQERYEPLEGWPPQLSMWRLRSLAGASDRTGVVNADSAPNP